MSIYLVVSPINSVVGCFCTEPDARDYVTRENNVRVSAGLDGRYSVKVREISCFTYEEVFCFNGGMTWKD